MRNFEFRPGKSVNLRARKPPLSATECGRCAALILTHLGSFDCSVLYLLTCHRIAVQDHIIIGPVDCAARSITFLPILSKSSARERERKAFFVPPPRQVLARMDSDGMRARRDPHRAQVKGPTGLTRRTSLLAPNPQPQTPMAAGVGEAGRHRQAQAQAQQAKRR